jgi:hypothetical protein
MSTSTATVRRWGRVAAAAALLAFVATVVAATVFAATAGIGAHRADARAGDEAIRSFDVDVTVAPDGSAEFVERIVYDFGTNDRHGIDRILVTRQRVDVDLDGDGRDDGKERAYPLTVESVASPDAPDRYAVSDVGGGRERIRIGDPDETVTGAHEYVIRYRLDGVANAIHEDTDELYWNVTGSEWQVDIERVSVTVTTPTAVLDLVCFAGNTGSTDPCTSASRDGERGAAFRHDDVLVPGEQVTVAVAYEDLDGAATEPQPILVARDEPYDWSEGFEATPLTLVPTGVLTVLFGWLVARTQFRVGRDRRAIGAPTDIAFAEAGDPNEPVPLFERGGSPVEFVPPDGIRPGQLGVLRDEVANTTDVSATIIDLAVRGYIRIEEIADDDGDVDDYRFVRLPKNGGLLAYESHLLSELFSGHGPEVELSSLKNTFAKSLGEVKDQLYADVVERGWFERRPDRVRLQWFLIGLGVAIVGGALTLVLGRFTHLGLLGLPVIAAGVALAIGAKWMPRRTAVGHGLYRRVLGFEDFIENSEKHRAQWAERKHLFTEYLPYAIAFGATKQWARTLESLGAPPPQAGGWYVGAAPYGWSGFGDRMTRFSSSASTVLSSTPGGSGSSGFSGGSSGGGGGGGGGGSW